MQSLAESDRLVVPNDLVTATGGGAISSVSRVMPFFFLHGDLRCAYKFLSLHFSKCRIYMVIQVE